MKMIKNIGTLLFAAALIGFTALPAQAAMIGTDSAVAMEQSQVSRDQLVAALQRTDVQEQLIGMGVSTHDAMERVAALTDAEVATLNASLADLPAGAGGGELVIIVLLILVITELTGVTDIF